MWKRAKHCRGWKEESSWPATLGTALIKQDLEKNKQAFQRVKQGHWELPSGETSRDREVLVHWLSLRTNQQSWGP